MDRPSIPWREIAALIFRQGTLIAAIFITGTLAAAVYAWMQSPGYQAAAQLMISPARARITVSPDANAKPSVRGISEEDLNSEVALLKSEALVREVLKPYRAEVETQPHGLRHSISSLLRLPFDLPPYLYRRLHRVPAPSPFEQWVKRTARRVEVTPVNKSSLIQVSYSDSNPTWTAKFVNELVAHHVERHVRLNQQSEAQRFFGAQRALLAEKLHDAEGNLRSFYEREGIDSVPEQRSLLRTRLAEMEMALAQADTQLAEGSARARFLAQQIHTYPKTVPSEAELPASQSLQVIKSHLLSLELKRSELLARFAPTSIKIHEVDRQIDDARRLLLEEQQHAASTGRAVNPTYQTLELDLAQTQAQVAAVGARVTALREQVGTQRTEMEHLDQIASEQDRLEEEVLAAKESFTTYLKKEEEARFANALDESRILNVAVVEPAEVPSAPQPSKGLATTFVGAILSLFAALAVAFVRDRLDPSVKSAAEAEALTGLPILADIPS